MSPGCVCRAGWAERAPDERTQGLRGRRGSIYDLCMRCLTLQGGERCQIDDFPLFCAATARKNSQQSHSRPPAITTYPKLVGGDIAICPQHPLSAPLAPGPSACFWRQRRGRRVLGANSGPHFGDHRGSAMTRSHGGIVADWNSHQVRCDGFSATRSQKMVI